MKRRSFQPGIVGEEARGRRGGGIAQLPGVLALDGGEEGLQRGERWRTRGSGLEVEEVVFNGGGKATANDGFELALAIEKLVAVIGGQAGGGSVGWARAGGGSGSIEPWRLGRRDTAEEVRERQGGGASRGAGVEMGKAAMAETSSRGTLAGRSLTEGEATSREEARLRNGSGRRRRSG